MNDSEDELSPLSALQHLLFCERQCALIILCLPKTAGQHKSAAGWLAAQVAS